MPCVYENIFPVSNGVTVEDARHIFSEQMQIHEKATFVGQPHIAFTLARDSDDYTRDAQFSLINKADFQGAITIGKDTVLYSDDNLAFENRPVRLTAVQVNKGASGKITIGDGVVMQGTVVVCYQEVNIGNKVLFGPKVTIMDSSGHPVTGRWGDDDAARTLSAKVTIKDNAWIGMGVTILKGVTIGENAVVGANSVVYQDVPDNCIAMGNPAQIVKQLDTAS
ncbi:acetyltransferase [Enterovibrio norvegicus]|uniref:Transferase hexapeptide (Six repeat-containing protein) n=2 Tax=Enterovibrio norvegicus TaxID=188144 RepID=A0A1I5WW40_9GAMM|nr:acyltransferase [Enterovibrio norvegicus]MCC4799794.1 acyltransferase [Enterovibrio norvegicus]OEE49926.1 acetyltransferase [Enterovibrio norvegicus]OEF50655.1 acetyltransferase [Enterovibrio norvegicus]OEF56179.1 acetyltransferase [Enterovibrio norvegicus]PMH63380.1 acetyltransferase [Enterovibrio norvegicus]